VVAVKRSGRRALLEFEDVEALFLAERLRRDLEVNAAGAGVILEMRRKMMALQQRLRELEEELDRLR
jgi:hypothetical protein